MWQYGFDICITPRFRVTDYKFIGLMSHNCSKRIGKMHLAQKESVMSGRKIIYWAFIFVSKLRLPLANWDFWVLHTLSLLHLRFILYAIHLTRITFFSCHFHTTLYPFITYCIPSWHITFFHVPFSPFISHYILHRTCLHPGHFVLTNQSIC